MKTIRSLSVLTLLSALLVPAQQSKSLAPQTIVFVCEHGSAKSVIAASHFNRLAKEKDLPYRAITRGTNPDAEIPPHIRRGLTADGLEVNGWIPRLISEAEIRDGERVVTFGCKLPGKAAGREFEDWNDIPSPTEDYGRARQAIVAHIDQLLKSLAVK